jgi:hypothetical protein
MSKKPRRKKHALQAGSYTLGGGATPETPVLDFAKPVLTVHHHVPLEARPFELQLEQEGYDAVDCRAIRFFVALMREHPNGVPGKVKRCVPGEAARPNHFDDCREHLRAHGEHITERRLEMLWTRAIDFTGATAFRTPGPK